MKQIISVDPGFTTGYVIAQVTKTRGVYELDNILRADMFKYPNFLEILTIAKDCDTIVIEDFLTRPEFYGQKNYSDRVIGCFEVLFQHKDVVFQMPSQKPAYSDNRLKTKGVWNKSLHIRDAYRHLFIYIDSLNKHPKKTFKTRRPR